MRKENAFSLYPVGIVHQEAKSSVIEIFPDYSDALLGIEQFSHIIVICWFHKNDIARKRKTLRVHPRGDRANPLTGVFATRSPSRPNPVALFTCRIEKVSGNDIYVDTFDAWEGSPVIDVKPYISRIDSVKGVRSPRWADN